VPAKLKMMAGALEGASALMFVIFQLLNLHYQLI
jgi:hypothetical protein